MAFRVEVLPRAFDDLDTITTHIQTRSSFRVAERWFNGILSTISSLAETPEGGPVEANAAPHPVIQRMPKQPVTLE